MFEPEINFCVKKDDIKSIVNATFKIKGSTRTVEVLDAIKDIGYKYATIGCITTSVFDMHIPQDKYDILDAAEKQVVEIEKMYERGFATEDERYENVVDVWNKSQRCGSRKLEKDARYA